MKSLCLALLFLLAACANSVVAQQNIVDTAAGAGNFNTLLTAAKAAGLADALATGNFTVFAPTDEAFGRLDPNTVGELLKPENKAKLAAILKYHVVPGSVSARDAYGLQNATSLNGQRLTVSVDSVSPTVGNANLIKADIQCSNGVIHVIDSVLMPSIKTIPEVAVSAGSFNTLLAAAQAAGLAETLGTAGPFTVFAPTDEAFAALPAGTVENLLKPENKSQLADILKYHVLSGRVYDTDAVKTVSANTLLGRSVNTSVSEAGLGINDATVVAKNIEASNGVIHVINKVLLPPPNLQLSPQETIGMINSAIQQGAGVFNAGDHQQCANIYMTTLKKISQSGVTGADAHTMSLISETMTSAPSHGATDQAWALRNCMDQVYARMQNIHQ
jgi:uncharacterized surface protein with fasciclin (FAS1) repeats